jgi:uncharacterized OB-fold protein
MSGTITAATVIRTAPAGFEPGYVVALVDVGGRRALHRLDDVTEAPRPGSIVQLGRSDQPLSSPAVVSVAAPAD